MNAKSEVAATSGGSSVLDTLKLVLSIVILVGGIWVFHHYEGVWPTYARVLEMAGAVVLAGLMMSLTATGRNFLGFALKSRDELRKVVWPTRQETLQSTLVILVVVLLVGILLWIIDSIIGAIMRMLLGS